MDTRILHKQKKELLDLQERMLNSARESQKTLDAAQETEFANLQSKVDAINIDINRFEAIEKGRREIGTPSDIFVPTETKDGKQKYSNCTAEYATNFWKSMGTGFRNAALGEGGTAADGSFLVPIQTDPSIPALAVIEASARKLSFVMSTEMDIKLPYQSAKTVAAAKAETNNSATGTFAANVPQFNTTTLT
jgi:HK97 family phage major capsid protein